MKIQNNYTKNVIKGYNDMIYDSGPVKYSDYISDKYNIVHKQLYERSLQTFLFDYIKNSLLNADNGFLYMLYKAIENTTPWDNSFDDENSIYDYITDPERKEEYENLLNILKLFCTSTGEIKTLFRLIISSAKNSLDNIEEEMITILKGESINKSYNYDKQEFSSSIDIEDLNSRITNFFLYSNDKIFLMEERSPSNENVSSYDTNDDKKIWIVDKDESIYKYFNFIISEQGPESETSNPYKTLSDNAEDESISADDRNIDDIADDKYYPLMLEAFSTDDFMIYYDINGNFHINIKKDIISDDGDIFIINELFDRILKLYNNELINNLVNIFIKFFTRNNNIIEIKNKEYWKPSSIIIISKRRPYKKYGPISLEKYWDNKLVSKKYDKSREKVIGITDAEYNVNSSHNTNISGLSNMSSLIDEDYKSDTLSEDPSYGKTIKDAEVIKLDYVKGVATMQSKLSNIEYEVDFDDLSDDSQISESMLYKPKFTIR